MLDHPSIHERLAGAIVGQSKEALYTVAIDINT
jgi:hypothetical protein